jgi:hypothetical protein
VPASKKLNIQKVLWLTAISAQVRTLRTRLHGWRAARPRYSSLQRAGCASSRFASPPAAHSGASNCRFEDDFSNLFDIAEIIG